MHEQFQNENPSDTIEQWKKLTDQITELGVGKKVKIATSSGRFYIIESRSDGLYISGHPKYCPEPTKLENILINESGMHYIFPNDKGWVNTTPFKSLEPIEIDIIE